MNDQSAITEEVGRYIFTLFSKQLSPDYVYHNYQHTMDTVAVCAKLAKAYNEISKDELEVLLLAAWFHDSGYVYAHEGHEEKSKEIAIDFLRQRNFEARKTDSVVECIENTKKNSRPSTLLAKIIADANIADIGQESYPAKAALLKTEWSKFGKIFNKEEWLKAQLDFMRSFKFNTEAAQNLYGRQVKINIEELEKAQEKIKKKKKKKEADVKDPRRGIQTMFRSIYRNHINLSSIADDKANMMIRVNSLIISIALTLVGAKFTFLGTSFKENQIIIYPIITLLLTGLGTIIFAILSAKPNITHKIHQVNDITDKGSSILFFGNFSTIQLNEFKDGMKSLITSKDDIYESMMTDIYFLGKVLTRKYRLIRISYTIFMIGLILTALVTLYVVIYLKKAGPAN